MYQKGAENGKVDALSRCLEYCLKKGGTTVQTFFKPGQLQLETPHIIISAVSLAALAHTSNLAKPLLEKVRRIAEWDSEYQQILQAV